MDEAISTPTVVSIPPACVMAVKVTGIFAGRRKHW